MSRKQSGKEGREPKQSRAKANARGSIARLFDHFAAQVTKWVGSSTAFCAAILAVVAWVLCGPFFGYSETWQLVINTGTTIVTFLMVFLIQQSQNKDSEALHLKLDELLIAMKGADERLVDAERLDEDKLLALAAARSARARKQSASRGKSATSFSDFKTDGISGAVRRARRTVRRSPSHSIDAVGQARP